MKKFLTSSLPSLIVWRSSLKKKPSLSAFYLALLTNIESHLTPLRGISCKSYSSWASLREKCFLRTDEKVSDPEDSLRRNSNCSSLFFRTKSSRCYSPIQMPLFSRIKCLLEFGDQDVSSSSSEGLYFWNSLWSWRFKELLPNMFQSLFSLVIRTLWRYRQLLHQHLIRSRNTLCSVTLLHIFWAALTLAVLSWTNIHSVCLEFNTKLYTVSVCIS